jgi:hypothetical protein
MNVFAADDLEAADLLALARLDDDGAPPAVIPPARKYELTKAGAAIGGAAGSAASRVRRLPSQDRGFAS